MDVKKLPTDIRSDIRSNIVIRDVKSCVFELVENALDAKATSISVFLDLRAFRIRIVDNGIGLTKHDLEAIGEGYVTRNHGKSRKLEKGTRYFGHRGEALKSISNSCKKLIITSKAVNSNKTYCKVIKSESISRVVRLSCGIDTNGTTVVVENLLFNRPVRRAATEPSVELDNVLHYLQANALINTKVSFILRDDAKDEELLKTIKCESMKESFLNLFPKILKFDDSLIEVCYENNKVKAFGLFSKEINNSNNLQFVFVNKKICNNRNIFKFINKLLGKSFYLKGISSHKGKSAIFVIEIKCPKHEYDEDIEEFKNWKLINDCIYEMIEKFVNGDVVLNADKDDVLKEIEMLYNDMKMNKNGMKQKKIENRVNRVNPKKDDVLKEMKMLYNDFKINNKPSTPTKVENVYENPMTVYGYKVQRNSTQFKTPENFGNEECKKYSQGNEGYFLSCSSSEKCKNLKTKNFSNEKCKKYSQEDMEYFSSCSSAENNLKICSGKYKNWKSRCPNSEEESKINRKIDNLKSNSIVSPLEQKEKVEKFKEKSTIGKVLNATRNYCLNMNMDFEKEILGKSASNVEYDVSASKLMLRQHFSNRNSEWKIRRNILKDVKSNKKNLVEKVITKERNKRKIRRKKKCSKSMENNSSSDENEIKRPRWSTVKNNKGRKRKREGYWKNDKEESSTESKEECRENRVDSNLKNSNCEFDCKKEKENKIEKYRQWIELAKNQENMIKSNTLKNTTEGERNTIEFLSQLEHKEAGIKNVKSNEFKVYGKNDKIIENRKIEKALQKNKEIEKIANNSTKLNEKNNNIPHKNFEKGKIDTLENKENGSEKQEEEIELIEKLLKNTNSRKRIIEVLKNELLSSEIQNGRNTNLFREGKSVTQRNEIEVMNRNKEIEFMIRNNENQFTQKLNNPPNLELECPSDYFNTQRFYSPNKSPLNPEIVKSSQIKRNRESNFGRKVKFCFDDLENTKKLARSDIRTRIPLKGIIQNLHSKNVQEINSPIMPIFSPVRLECVENFEFMKYEENRGLENSEFMKYEKSRGSENFEFRKYEENSGSENFEFREYEQNRGSENFEFREYEENRGSENFEFREYEENRGSENFEFREYEENRGSENFEFSKYEENRDSENFGFCKYEENKNRFVRKNNQKVENIWLKSIYDESFRKSRKEETSIIEKSLPGDPINPSEDIIMIGHDENESWNINFLSCKENEKTYEIDELKDNSSNFHSSFSYENFANSPNVNYNENSPEKIECIPSQSCFLFSFEGTSDASYFSISQCDERIEEDDANEGEKTQVDYSKEISPFKNDLSKEAEEGEALWTFGEMEENKNYDQEENMTKEIDGYLLVDEETKLNESKEDTGQFKLEERNAFLPKGLSPYVMSNREKNLSKSLTDSQRNILHETVNSYPKGEPSTPCNVIETIKKSNFTNRSIEDEINALNTSVIFTKEDLSNFQVIANLDNKFILTRVRKEPCNSNLVVVMDQHAVHERIRLEMLLQDYRDKNGNLRTSSLNPSIRLNLNESKVFIMERHKRQFQKIGIHFQVCSGHEYNLNVSAVPVCIVNKAQKEGNNNAVNQCIIRLSKCLIEEVIQEIKLCKGSIMSVPNILQDIINSEACSGAIKFGDRISKDTAVGLVKNLKMCKIPFQCAHGRPLLAPLVDISILNSMKEKEILNWERIQKRKNVD